MPFAARTQIRKGESSGKLETRLQHNSQNISGMLSGSIRVQGQANSTESVSPSLGGLPNTCLKFCVDAASVRTTARALLAIELLSQGEGAFLLQAVLKERAWAMDHFGCIMRFPLFCPAFVLPA